MIWLELLLGFLKVGLFSFGGAYAAIPLVRDVVQSYGWMSEDMLMDMIAVSESTPGPIMVNLATYVGASQAGFLGAVLATAVVVLPAFVIILLLTALLQATLKNPWVQAALRGLKPCVAGVILAMAVSVIAGNCWSGAVQWPALLLTAGLALLYFGSRKVLPRGLSPVALILISAVAGVAVYGL